MTTPNTKPTKKSPFQFDRFAWRKIVAFIKDHWIVISVTLAVLVLIGIAAVGIMGMESFYRKMQLAQLPIQLLFYVIGAVISALIYVTLMFGQFGRIGSKKIKSTNVNVKFSDVLGIDEAKDEALEVVQLLKDHSSVRKVGGKIIKGLLMVGDPGCGKTYLAKAIATESGLPFSSLSASEFVEIFVGVGSRRVRELFKKARKEAYAHGGAIVFIDEIDAIGRARTFSFMGGQETNSTLNQLLVEMDGLQNEKENVVVIGATNSPENVLDPALLRPGRFDRILYIDKPNLKGREDLFRHYLSKVKYDPSIDIPRLARISVSKSPAEIENVVKEASLISIRNKHEFLTYKDISEAIERIELGVKHRKHMTDEERNLVAYHEAGHLITLYILHPTDDVFKASIISRRGALGVVYHQPREELFLHDRQRLLANIKVALSGYAAERIKFGTTTSGVAADFVQASQLAHVMVWRLGMGERHTGNFDIIPENRLSERMKDELNADAEHIIRTCLAEVEALLRQEISLLDRFANELLQKDELEYDEIDAVFKEYKKIKLPPRKFFPLSES